MISLIIVFSMFFFASMVCVRFWIWNGLLLFWNRECFIISQNGTLATLYLCIPARFKMRIVKGTQHSTRSAIFHLNECSLMSAFRKRTHIISSCYCMFICLFICFLPKVWKESLREITHNNKINNVCPRTNLMKQYVPILFLFILMPQIWGERDGNIFMRNS
jgi:hypothetical protein